MGEDVPHTGRVEPTDGEQVEGLDVVAYEDPERPGKHFLRVTLIATDGNFTYLDVDPETASRII